MPTAVQSAVEEMQNTFVKFALWVLFASRNGQSKGKRNSPPRYQYANIKANSFLLKSQ